MRVVDTSPIDAANPEQKKRRMEALLFSWRSYPRWLPTDAIRFRSRPPDHTSMTTEQRGRWSVVLRAATPIPPRTYVGGFEFYANLHQHTAVELVSDGVALIIGNRVAVDRGRGSALRLSGHTWSMSLSPSAVGLEVEECKALICKRFRNVFVDGDRIIGTEAWGEFYDDVAILLEASLAEGAPIGIERFWRLARALKVHVPFLMQLPEPLKRALANMFVQELDANNQHLGVETDARLAWFTDGAGDAEEAVSRALYSFHLPRSRLAALIDTNFVLEHLHRPSGEDYFSDLVHAYVHVADVFPLAELLHRLPPGRTLVAGIEALLQFRPELLATFAWTGSFPAVSALSLERLPDKLFLGPGYSLDLTEEWSEVQELGSELLILGQRSEDRASVVCFGVHKERTGAARDLYGQDRLRPLHRDERIWQSAAENCELAQAYVEVLEASLQARVVHSEAEFIFALRLVEPLRQTQQSAACRRLCSAIVEAYSAGFQLNAEVYALPKALRASGELLDQLRTALLSLDMRTSWERWLNPFDISSYLQRASFGGEETPLSVDPKAEVPRIVRTHAENVAAQGVASADSEEALTTILNLYFADIATSDTIQAFSPGALGDTIAFDRIANTEPLFARVGVMLSQSKRAGEWLDRILATKPHALLLAHLALGAGEQHNLRLRLMDALRPRLTELLAEDSGLGLGHCLDLASVLHRANAARDAERFARRALQLAERLKPWHDVGPFANLATAILIGALAQQQQWEEIVGLDLQLSVVDEAGQFAHSVYAVALMELQRFEEAEDTLKEVLDYAPRSKVAHSNLTALYVKRQEWQLALDASARAKSVLSEGELDSVFVNELLARERLNDVAGVAALYGTVRDRAGVSAFALAALDRLREHAKTGASATETTLRGAIILPAPPQAPDADTGEPPLSDQAVDIAILTAIQTEFDAVLRRLTNATPVSSVEGQLPNHHSWTTGEIVDVTRGHRHRVVLALAGRAGVVPALLTATDTIERWNPKSLLLVGIAGGLQKDNLKQGDIVLAQSVWYYESGKIADGEFRPRHHDTHSVHSGLLNSAQTFASSQAWHDLQIASPIDGRKPQCLVGMVASGEKVIDDLEPEFVRAILRGKPELQAMEMEAHGVCSAIKKSMECGRPVCFMMVRGISDLPASADRASGAGTSERDNWKPHAAQLAAHFTVSWIASERWPFPPRSPGQR